MQATRKGFDQTARMRRLIWGFAGRRYISCRGSNNLPENIQSQTGLLAGDNAVYIAIKSKNDSNIFQRHNDYLNKPGA